MRRPAPPLMLRDPIRWPRIGRTPARVLLGAMAVLSLLTLVSGSHVPRTETGQQTGFAVSLVDRLKHGGEDYYTAAAATLRGSGLPVSARSLPAPAGPFLAALPGMVPAMGIGFLFAALVLAWSDRFARIRGRVDPGIAMIAIGSSGAIRPGWITIPALWAGLLIALALGLRRTNRWWTAAALGASAAIIHPGALLFIVVMAMAAWRERQRREALAWAAALILGIAVTTLHAGAAHDVIGPASVTTGWAPAGPLPALRALADASGLSVLPACPGLLLAALAVAGWIAWRDPVAVRAQAMLVAGLLLLAFLPADRAQDALLVAPISLLGLLPAIDALRALVAAALDSRGITVTRVTR